MRKGKIISSLLAFALVCTTALPMNINTASAAANTQDNDNAQVQIKEQEPVEVTNFSTSEGQDEYSVGDKIEFDKSDVKHFKSRTVIAGSVSDYLQGTGDALVYGLSLPAGIYLQAQLTTPADASLDYDLYLLDSEGYIITGSEYLTYVNGTYGTLPETMGYNNTSGSTATYYLYVLSSAGGSSTQAFTLDYTVSNSCDSYEIDENVSQARSFTVGTNGATVNVRNLSSPIDNDWYKITVPQSRNYDKLTLSCTTSSANKCSVELYQNVDSSGYKMKRIGGSGKTKVSTGTYYIRVSNKNSMEEFDDADIQNYSLSVVPVLRPTGIVITDMKGTHGLNKSATYGGKTKFVTGTGNLTVYGTVYAYDSTTGDYYVTEGQDITVEFNNPSWENSIVDATITESGWASSLDGTFEVELTLPVAAGAHMADVGLSYHYYDECTVKAYVDEYSSVGFKVDIYQLSYTEYHGGYF